MYTLIAVKCEYNWYSILKNISVLLFCLFPYVFLVQPEIFIKNSFLPFQTGFYIKAIDLQDFIEEETIFSNFKHIKNQTERIWIRLSEFLP